MDELQKEEIEIADFNLEANEDLGKSPFAVLWEEEDGKSIMQQFLPWIVISGFFMLAILILTHK